ncbi:hypothetical protein T484DRAFT_1779190 [Baffinella frigidus]|nr:hypothetical protein T484DRAFT_1779190 [Cryptophyta sp. CCMP2293]
MGDAIQDATPCTTRRVLDAMRVMRAWRRVLGPRIISSIALGKGVALWGSASSSR